MTASTLAERLAGSDSRPGNGPFLDSHRATAACRRELDRLNDELGRRLSELHSAGSVEAVVVRASPERSILQLGPVALTLAWLKGAQDSVAEGELLIIVWHGVAGRRPSGTPERKDAAQPPAAAALWEEVLIPIAADEAMWGWQIRGENVVRTSAEVAERCVEHLQNAYARFLAA
jgi:hypothetical protein